MIPGCTRLSVHMQSCAAAVQWYLHAWYLVCLILFVVFCTVHMCAHRGPGHSPLIDFVHLRSCMVQPMQ